VEAVEVVTMALYLEQVVLEAAVMVEVTALPDRAAQPILVEEEVDVPQTEVREL
jgi:hypothetical protein